MFRHTTMSGVFVTFVTGSLFFSGCDHEALEGEEEGTGEFDSGRDDLDSVLSDHASEGPDRATWRLTPQEIELGKGIERAPNPARLADPEDLPPDDGAVDPGLDLDPRELYELAQKDPSWRSNDGRRYEAMLVLEDGTAFGQIGPAPTAPSPEESNRHGGFTGFEGPPHTFEAAIDDRAMSDKPTSPDDLIGDEPDAVPAILGGALALDRRSRVSSLTNLTQYPERTIGALNQTQSAGFTGCTGTKVGPRTVLTASHCVLDADGNWTTSGWFHPGQTNGSHPNTSGTAVRWSGVYARDWRLGRQFEYAILYLQDRADSYGLGWLGIAWWNSAGSYQGVLARVLGYPQKSSASWNRKCKASPLASDNCDGWMYRDSHSLGSEAYIGSGELQYNIDTTAGESGSTVLTKLGNGDWVTLGAHWGCSNCTYRNRSSRFRSSMWNDVCSWIAAVPSAWGSHPICD